MNYVTLAFSHDKSDWISGVMAWFTFGDYTHVAIVEGEEVIEASGVGPNSGVRVVPLKDFLAKHKDVVFRKIPHSKPWKVWERAKSQVGKRYDWLWILGYVLHINNMQDESRWSCSELVAWSLGEPLFPKRYLWFINPQTIYMMSKEI